MWGKLINFLWGLEESGICFSDEMDFLCSWCPPKPSGECGLIFSILEMKLKAPGVERL